MKTIIFICKYNRFRSQVAEAYFKKINKNKNIRATSAGLFQGIPVAKNVINIGKKYGMKISSKPRGIRETELVGADKIIIVADDIPRHLFTTTRFDKKVVVWKIPDTSQSNEKGIEKIIKKIMKKVDKLKV